jgi:hypothetical protein
MKPHGRLGGTSILHPLAHSPGRRDRRRAGVGGANAAPKWWVFVPVPEERTKREPFCSAPPTTKLQAKPGPRLS